MTSDTRPPVRFDTSHPDRRRPSSVALVGVALAVLVACSAGGGGGAASPADVTPARLAPPDSAVSCDEWVRRAAAEPEMSVDRVPEPIAYDPAPLPKRLPRGVLDKNGRGEVRIRVLVDTGGKADMKTFAVVKSTHASLTRSVRSAVARWTFRPAEINGCKVPRLFNWGAVAGGAPPAAK
jgi:hypothetical protein